MAGNPSPPPSPEQMAELVRRGASIRREAERLVEDAFRAIAEDPALGPEAARDVATFLARRRNRWEGQEGQDL